MNLMNLSDSDLLQAYNKSNQKCNEISWQLFCDYNIQDVVLVDKLEDKLKLIELQMTIAYMAKVNYEDIFGQVKVWETIIYNYLRKQNSFPSIQRSKLASGNIVGGFVKEPLIGKHRYVASVDLDGLYPHVMMGWNMSPETLVSGFNHFRDLADVDKFLHMEIDTSKAKTLGYSVAANGVCFDNNIPGFLPALMLSLYNDRKKYKKQMLKLQAEYQTNPTKQISNEIARLNNLQLGIKTALNSAYGALANEGFRYYDLRIAEGITLSGQLAIKWIAKKFNEFFNKLNNTNDIDYVIAIDTDSNYLSLENMVNNWAKGKDVTEAEKIQFMDKFCEKVLQPFIDKSYVELAEYMNCKEQKMSMKRENLCDIAIFTGKKKYILNVWNSEGVQYNEPKLKIVGLEIIKSSTPEAIKTRLRETIPILLKGNNNQLRKFVKDFKNDFRELSIEEIAFPRGVNDLEKYAMKNGKIQKCTPINVRAALLFNDLIKKHKLGNEFQEISSGDKIKYIYLRIPNPLQQNVIGFNTELPKDFKLDKYIDYDLMFDKVFLSSVDIMANAIGWSTKEESTLKDFF